MSSEDEILSPSELESTQLNSSESLVDHRATGDHGERADSDNEGELDLQEFTQLVKSLEHGPVRPTPSDRRSEAALALRTRRHRHAKLSQGLDTTTFRHQWTSTEDAKDAPRRSADRVVHRATWARQQPTRQTAKAWQR